jgi:YggT family protein
VALLFLALDFVVLCFLIILIGRLIIDWVQVFARDWRPRGVVLVLAEVVYTVTDPPLRALRRVIKPIRLGSVQLDLAFMVLFLLCIVVRSILARAAVALA